MLRIRMVSYSLDRSSPRASLGCCSEVSFSIPLSVPSAKFFCRENDYACLIEFFQFFFLVPASAFVQTVSVTSQRAHHQQHVPFGEFAIIRSELGKCRKPKIYLVRRCQRLTHSLWRNTKVGRSC